MYKTSFKLTPITPMVHFQKGNDLSIRGSELKPLFDSFISQSLIDEHIGKKYGHRMSELALDVDGEKEGNHYDYQIRVESLSSTAIKTPDNHVFFLKGKQLYNLEIKVTFLSRHIKLMELIVELFPYFVSQTFFGFRKGKGFGQFKIVGEQSSTNLLENIKKSYKIIGKEIKVIEINRETIDPIQTLEQIRLLNREIKAMYLHEYSESEGIYTEKKVVEAGSKSAKTYYMRGMLGLATGMGKLVESKPEYSIKKTGRIRIPNPFKYYVSDDYQKIYLVIELKQLEKIQTHFKDTAFRFNKTKGGTEIKLFLPPVEEVSSDFWNGFVDYLEQKEHSNIEEG